jgi:predicted porin
LEKFAMKKSLIALATLAAVSGTAFAQSSVSISGGVRIGYGDVGGVKGLSTNQGSGNTMNFNIVEDLGGGLKAMASTQFRWDSTNTHNANGTDGLFHLASVGLTGGFGTVQAGRIGLNGQWAYNAFGSTSAGVASAADQARGGATQDGQLRYTSPKFSGFSVELAQTDKGADARKGSQVRASYANGPVSVSYIKEELTAAGADTTSIGASYNLGFATLMVVNADNEAAGKATTFGAKVPMGAVTFKAQQRNGKDAVADVTAFGVDYALSKRTVVEVNNWKVDGGTTNTWFGVRHSY